MLISLNPKMQAVARMILQNYVLFYGLLIQIGITWTEASLSLSCPFSYFAMDKIRNLYRWCLLIVFVTKLLYIQHN
jgi:hypothetical protein